MFSIRHLRIKRIVIGILLFPLGQAACSHDPNVQRKKFLAQRDQAFQKGKFSVAAIFYERAIQNDPRFGKAHFKLGQTRLKMSSWMEAYREFSRTVELQPENWQAQLSLGQLELAGGERQEAKDRALLILHSDPRDGDAQMLLANADAALGNPKEAPGNLAYRYHLGLTYQKLNETAQPRVQLNKIIDMDPKSPFAGRARQALSNISSP